MRTTAALAMGTEANNAKSVAYAHTIENLNDDSITLLLAPLWLAAEDWSHFRGPQYDGISREKNWLTDWPETGAKRLWEAQVGIGFSSMAVAKGRLYTLGHNEGADTLYCLDAKTGRKQWSYSWLSNIGAKLHTSRSGSTPTVVTVAFMRRQMGRSEPLVPHPKTLAKVRCSGRGISPRRIRCASRPGLQPGHRRSY